MSLEDTRVSTPTCTGFDKTCFISLLNDVVACFDIGTSSSCMLDVIPFRKRVLQNYKGTDYRDHIQPDVVESPRGDLKLVRLDRP